MRRGTQDLVAKPRGPTRAPVWIGGDTCAVYILFVLCMVIVHISIHKLDLS